jgi:hypothetical protein
LEEATMTVQIPLRLQGIDLRDADAYDRVDPDLSGLFWEAIEGVSLAVVLSEEPRPAAIGEAIDWARRIRKLLPAVRAVEVYDELVSIPDIAVRTAVGAEAARLWAAGKRRSSLRPFPAPRQVVGGGSGGRTMSLYAWREVVSWVRDVIGIDPEEDIEFLTDEELAHLNAELADIAAAPAWRALDVKPEQILFDVHYGYPDGVFLPSDSFDHDDGGETTDDGYRVMMQATC